ncbi:MAG: hypothetical protein ACOC0P_00345 [Planctomycetota bacterium]
MTETPDNTHTGDDAHRERGGRPSPRDERSEAGGTVGVMEWKSRRREQRPIEVDVDRDSADADDADGAPLASDENEQAGRSASTSAHDLPEKAGSGVSATSASGMLMAGEQIDDSEAQTEGETSETAPSTAHQNDRHPHRNGHYAGNGVTRGSDHELDDDAAECAIGGGNVTLIDATREHQSDDRDRLVDEDEGEHSAAMSWDGNATAGTEIVHTGGEPKLTRWARFEAWLERAASRSSHIRKLTSRIYLPLAFHSGLTMKKLDAATFTCVLPFRRFNRNWYNAMAGAALLANSEIAAGMYLFGELGGKWTIVCKNLNYRFLRPCFGPAIYRVTPLQDLPELMHAGREFNIDLSLEVLQHVKRRGRERRVGRCDVTFHCAPKAAEGNRAMEKRVKRRGRRR